MPSGKHGLMIAVCANSCVVVYVRPFPLVSSSFRQFFVEKSAKYGILRILPEIFISTKLGHLPGGA